VWSALRSIHQAKQVEREDFKSPYVTCETGQKWRQVDRKKDRKRNAAEIEAAGSTIEVTTAKRITGKKSVCGQGVEFARSS